MTAPSRGSPGHDRGDGALIRPASTVLALRPARNAFEVLMVRRAGASVFMGGAFVFPGGAIDDADRGEAAAAAVDGHDPTERAWHAAALRELAEEAGVLVTDPPAPADLVARCVALTGDDLYCAVAAAGLRFAAGRLAYLSNWITPPGPPRRFDTRFYVAAVPAGTAACADGHEVTEVAWVSPADAIGRAAAGEWHVPFPTLRHVELLARFDTVDGVLAHARAQAEVPRVAPRVVPAAGGHRVLMPGEPGYEAAGP